jgi:hypothetical protein
MRQQSDLKVQPMLDPQQLKAAAQASPAAFIRMRQRLRDQHSRRAIHHDRVIAVRTVGREDGNCKQKTAQQSNAQDL